MTNPVVVTPTNPAAETTSVTSTPRPRPAVRWCNYNADVRHMVGEVHGSNTLGEFMTAVSADYDEATGKTRVGWAFATVHDIEAAKTRA